MSEVYIPDNLFAGHVMPKVDDSLIVASGQGVLARGTLLGLVTATGKAKVVSKTANDGSEKVYAVLAENIDTTNGDVLAPVYLTGEFNENALTVAAGNTVAEHKASARAVGIFIKSTLSV
jgi:Bacteriophage lambda head decoration protein D